MNILTVIQRYHPVIGGSEIFAKSFMDFLAQNHKVTVYTTNAEDIHAFWDKNGKKITSDTTQNYEIKRYDFLTPTEIGFEEKLNDFPFATSYPGPFSPAMWNDLVLKKIDFDLIYATAFPYDHIIPAYVASKKWKIPIIITPLIHQEYPELYLTAMRLTMLNNSDGIFVISESERKLLIKHGIDEKKISIIQPFVNHSAVSLSPKEVKKQFSINPKNKIILFAGSKSFVKGIIHLIEAMKEVWKIKSDLTLVIIGPSTKEFDEYFHKLPKKIREKIMDLGIVNEETKQKLFSSCEIFVLPSKSESFGLVYLEAWLCGKPVIGCNLPPISEIIEDKKNGILVEFGKIKKLSESILYLINNPSLCEKFGIEGMKKASLYNSKDNLKNFENKCSEIIKNFKKK